MRGVMARVMLVPALALVAALLVWVPGAPAQQFFKWMDSDGIVHYTAELQFVPPQYRESVTTLNAPPPNPWQAPAPAPTAPPASDAVALTPGGPLITSAHLNGVALSLVVDTGADRTVISPAAIARAGFAIDGAVVRILGVTGTATAREVVVPRLDVAGRQLGPLAIVAHDVAVDGVDGLLGRDVLDYFTLTVDSAAGRATLTPR